MLIAGVDVGNTTTEIVVIDSDSNPPGLVTWDRTLTRGIKGSDQSLRGAADLLRRLERRLGKRVDLLAVAPQHPVDTRLATLPELLASTGRLEVLPAPGKTLGGTGAAVGAPILGSDRPRSIGSPIVLLFESGTGFRSVVKSVDDWISAGNEIGGVLLADDEGVLVSSRLHSSVPVIDQVVLQGAVDAIRVALEIRPHGQSLSELTDPIRLSNLFGLAQSERKDAVGVAAALNGRSCAVVALHKNEKITAPSPTLSVLLNGQSESSVLDLALVSSLPVGAIKECILTNADETSTWEIDDLWAVALSEVAASVANRIESTNSKRIVLATLSSHTPNPRPDLLLSQNLGVPVKLIDAETTAARTGALTTPGVRQESLVLDLGGGTIDLMAASGREVIAAGAGEMLTASVAAFLQVPRGAAEWVKRGPSSRVEAPQILLAEDGVRTFIDRPVPASTSGSLVVPGPAGLLPFSTSLAPAEWRALRLRLKQRVIADNLLRTLQSLNDLTDELLLVGGAAGDEELLGLLASSLTGYVVGRGNVAGILGHRYAVAYGLALLSIS
jgi:hypothetical protein